MRDCSILLLAVLLGGPRSCLECTWAVIPGVSLSFDERAKAMTYLRTGSKKAGSSPLAEEEKRENEAGLFVHESFTNPSVDHSGALPALLSRVSAFSPRATNDSKHPTGKAPVFTELGVSSEGESEQPDAEGQESEGGADDPSEEGGAGRGGHAEGTGVYSQHEHWYSIRTNFAPRLLRVLAKKSEAEKGQEWYTILTNFKPHILKLTPEDAA